MFRRKKWTAAGAPTTSGSGPAHRRARYVAGGVTVVGLLAAAAVGSGATGAAAAVPPGSLDTAFGTGGIVTTNLTALGAGGEEATMQEPNGDILVDLFQGMLRFLPNGQVDTSFGTNGLATGILVEGGAAMAVQPNGQIITSGVNLAGPPTSPAVGITRLNANGTVDTTFGTDGTTTIPVTLAGRATTVGAGALLVQADGKILVAGSASVQTGRRTGVTDGVVARLNANGTLDTTFGTGGLTLITANQFPSGLGLGAAGDIFALPSQSQLTQQGVTELSPSGQLDATVTPEPLTATSAGYPVDKTNDQFVFSQNEHPSGFEGFIDPEIIRFTTAGAVASDTGLFPFTGTSLFVQDFVNAVAVLPSGQALAIGSHTLVRATGTTGAITESAFARVNPNGTLDSSFGTGGMALTNVNFTSGGFGALFPQSDGTAITVGEGTLSSGQTGLVIARFNV